jgi:ribulose-phosphate 3-epimerase
MSRARASFEILPSILSFDFGFLAKEARRIEKAGADGIHVDIMDGHFVPDLTLGPRAVAALRRATALFLDIHLMVYNPCDYIEPFVIAGADQITFHFEATEDVKETAQLIRTHGKKVGIAFSPDTPFPRTLPLFSWCDQVLVMTVAPGLGGQHFLPDMLDKIATVVQLSPPETRIQVDGGINCTTAVQCRSLGATSFVSGTYLVQQPDLEKAILHMREAIGAV